VSDGPVSLDRLAADIVSRSGYRFAVATTDADRDVAYRLRYAAVIDQGWPHDAPIADGREQDLYDERAVHVVGWDGESPIATGRLVLPPGSLPTEDVCGIIVEPHGHVADVGRMTVARSHQGGAGHSVFLALLARLYLEVRNHGFEVACGIMSPRMRSLLRLLGLQLDVLGDDRPYWGEARAPVRFAVTINTSSLTDRWR
jgi:hypothetical protein